MKILKTTRRTLFGKTVYLCTVLTSDGKIQTLTLTI